MQNYSKPSIIKKRQNKAKYLTQNSIRLTFIKKTSMSNPVKSLGYVKCYRLSRSIPVKSSSSSILSDLTVRRSAVDQKIKTVLEIRIKTTFIQVIKKPIIYKLFKDFSEKGKNTNRVVVFSCTSFPNILNAGTTNDTFQQSGKQDSFRPILKSSASMYEKSGSVF